MKRNKQIDIHAKKLTELRRLTPYFYYWRYHQDNNPEDITTHRGLATINPKKINPVMIEYELHRLAVNYQALTISYCRDPWGNTYKHFSLVTTNEPLRFLDDDVTVLILAARTHAEQNANVKHVYARAMILMPAVKGKSNLMTVLKRHQKELHLDEREIQEFSSINNEEAVIYDVPRIPQLDIDKEIREHLDLKLTA